MSQPSPSPSGDPCFALTVHRTNDRRAVLVASGELDLSAAADLSDFLGAHEAVGRTIVQLDLSGVTFIDSSCLGVLLDTHRRLLAAPGRLILSSISPAVATLLKATRLEKTLLSIGGATGPIGLVPRRTDPDRVVELPARRTDGTPGAGPAQISLWTPARS